MRDSRGRAVAAAAILLIAGTATATEDTTIFDRLYRLDATSAAQTQRAAKMQRQVDALDEELERRWTSLDVAMRAARPIRNTVTEGLGRWLRAHRATDREAMDGPHAGADTRRLLRYAAPHALPSRLRDVDVVRRADAERVAFVGAMGRRAQWSVQLGRVAASAEAAADSRDALLEKARVGGADTDLEATATKFDELLASLPDRDVGGDFHRLKGTLARPVTMRPDYHFGASGPLVRPHGWTYRPAVGAHVHAIGPGIVSFVGVVQGWGLAVTLTHAGGYVSTYSHLDESSVAVGDEVDRADVIAAAGESGSLDGARLYFELRRDGEPVDPTGWFLKE